MKLVNATEGGDNDFYLESNQAHMESRDGSDPTGDAKRAAAMSSQVLVSVVIPTYNRAFLLPRAIESVRRQTHTRLEILIVDDGSKEDIARVVNGIRDDRIRYIRHEKNKGLPAARNTGILAARGDVVAFLDDDDEWRPDKLEKQLVALKKFDAVACTAIVNGFIIRNHKRRNITVDDLRRGGFAPSGLLAKTYVLRNVMFDECLRQGEDWDGFIRIAQRYSMGYVPEPLLVYHEGGHASMTNEAKRLSLPELEKRTAVIYKHRHFLGERWFKFHLADTFLCFLMSRQDKLQCIRYALKRCGPAAVGAVLLARAHKRLRRLLVTGK